MKRIVICLSAWNLKPHWKLNLELYLGISEVIKNKDLVVECHGK